MPTYRTFQYLEEYIVSSLQYRVYSINLEKAEPRIPGVPLAQWIARWTSNPKVLGSTPRWDDGFFLFPCFSWLLCDMAVAEAQFPSASFLSVAVITCASHAQGRRFEPGRKHPYFASSSTKARLAEAGDTR